MREAHSTSVIICTSYAPRPKPLWLLVLAGAHVWALDPARSIDQLQLTSWTTQRGLPHDHINAIAQTPDGYLWIATPTGLARFDGLRFAVFDKRNAGRWPSDDIAGLLAGRDGSLWITHFPGGLTRLYRGQFESHRGPDSHAPAIAEDRDGAIWLATDAGLCRFQGGRFTTFSPGPRLARHKVWWVGSAPDGSVWFTAQSGLGRVRGGKPESYRTHRRFLDETIPWLPLTGPAPQAPAPPGFRLSAPPLLLQPGLHVRLAGGAYVDSGNFLHLPARDGLIRHRGDELIFHPLAVIRDHPITAMHRDAQGSLWLGLRGLGLCRWGAAGFDEPGPQSPLRGHEVSAIFEDGEGSLWIGTRGAGLLRLTDAEVSKLPYPAPVAGAAQAVLEDSRGALWVSTSAALLRYFQGRWTSFDSRHGLQGLPVRSMAETSDGALWFGTQDGFLHQYVSGSFRHYWLAGSQDDSGPVSALCPAPDGALWIGTGWSGAARWKSGQLEQYRVEHGLSSNRITAISADRAGGIWIGTQDRGLNRLHEGRIQQFTTRDGLGSDSITSLRTDGDGVVWIGTNGGGLSRWKGGAFRTYTYRQGLADDVIFAIVEDSAGFLWMGSGKGIFRVRKADLEALDRGRGGAVPCRSYDESDGMWSRSVTGFNQPSASRGVGNRLWFATERGVVSIDAGRPERARRAPAVLLEEAVLNGQPFNPASRAAARPGPGHLRFTYTAASLRDAERVRFRYFLEGFDTGWQDAETRREVQYTGIPPGDYTFKVAACLPDGECSAEALSYGFRLEPRFYQTRWFPALCATFLALLLWTAYRLRLRMLRREFAAVLAERNRIAGELHDGLLQSLAGVLTILDAAGSRLIDAPAQAKQVLDRGRFLLRDSLAQARHSVWDIRRAGETDDLGQALEKLAAELGAGAGARIELAMQGRARPLGPATRENVLRIAREALVNSIKHAGATLIRLEGAYSAKCFRLSIQDDGRGFSPEESVPERCFGLLGMRERAQRIGADLEIRSAPGKGCEIVALVPLDGKLT